MQKKHGSYSLAMKAVREKMTLILDMDAELETQVREAAAREGIEPEQYVLEAVKERLERARQTKAAEEQRKAEALEWAEGMRPCSD